MKKIEKFYEYIVIGAGSGGLASGRYVAKTYGKKVAVIEHKRIGGTCVNVGCMPKKVSYLVSEFMNHKELFQEYGVSIKEMKLDYAKFKQKRENYIQRLNDIYHDLVKKSNVDYYKGFGKFIDNQTVQVGDQILKGEKILIATGGIPFMDDKTKGIEHCINSNGFFELDDIPESVIVVGSGYIGLELAQIIKGMGCKDVTILYRSKILRFLDDDIRDIIEYNLKHNGINLVRDEIDEVIKQDDDQLLVKLKKGDQLKSTCVLTTTGRIPNTKNLGIENTGVKLGKKGEVLVNEFDQTNVDHIYAIGDVIDKINLTPMAIRAGRVLAERLFGNKKNLVTNYENVPTVVFAQPPIAYVGLNKQQAIDQYGEDNINVYTSNWYSTDQTVYEDKNKREKSFLKLICLKTKDNKILGIQGVGKGMDENMQGFAVAVTMGATKKDFHRCVPIHPTSSEEFILIDFEFPDQL